MPGIVGLVTKMPRRDAEAELQQMLGSMRHEPFYSARTWMDEELGVYLGWTAREGSFSDCGPIQNETRDIVLVFSGEEHPAPDTARRLKNLGHELAEAEASYLVHLYEEDPAFPAGLNGRFHGVLVDRRRRTVSVFNDRYGMHRLYYHESKDAVYFAAEAKAILAVRPELRRVDARGLGEFVSLGCVLENRTLFDGIRLLPGGSSWVFENGDVATKTTYFQPREWEEQPPLEGEEFYRQMRDVFARILPRYFNGRERVGMSLTGGLDTRMIMAWQKCPPGSLPCYTFGGTRRDSQDVVVARQVARVCEQPYSLIVAGNEFLSRFAHYAERSVYLTDGCTDLSLCPDLFMYERAREIAPVRMSGNYGGEVLRRVRAFKPVEPMPGLFSPELLSHVRAADDTYARLTRQHPLTFNLFSQAPWHHYGVLALEQTQTALRTPYLDNEFVRTVFRAPASACESNDVCLRLIGEGSAALRALRTDRGLGGGAGGLQAAAVRGTLEFLFKAEYGYDYGMPQWVARMDHLLSPLRLDRLFLGRHKFYHFRVWYRDALSAYVREMLLDPRTLARPYTERKQVEAVVEGHLKGDRNYTLEIHKLLTLELVHRLFLDA